MFDIKTLPKVYTKEISYNEIDIVLAPDRPKTFCLNSFGRQWMVWDQYTNKQYKSQYSQYDMAYGDVLLTGFGFGLLACWLANKPEVKSVTVIEYSKSIYDIFLMNNELPKNVNVIIDDANNYKTEKHFDCIFLDHYEGMLDKWVYRNIKQISENIPNHNLIWTWALEETIAVNCLNINNSQLQQTFLWNNYVNFYDYYLEFKNNVVKVLTLPDLTQEKINEYVLTYYDRIGYSAVLS
jgi:hypothetical protein